jgi:hypothetical protein
MIDIRLVILAQWSEKENKWNTYTADGSFIASFDGSISDKSQVEGYAPHKINSNIDGKQYMPTIFYNEGFESYGVNII